jgi:hypothetical protein
MKDGGTFSDYSATQYEIWVYSSGMIADSFIN